ncbi:MAG TPA: phosphatase PAP2 family protein [Candidatus Acidoferrales bacterium]
MTKHRTDSLFDELPPRGRTLAHSIVIEDSREFTGGFSGDELANAANGFLERVIATFGPFEWVTFTYLAWLEFIFFAFHRNIAHAPRAIAVHLAIALGVAILACRADASENKIFQFVRHWYPLPLYIFFFEELQGLVHAIFPGWFDRWLIQFDFNLAGVHPSVWLNQFANPVLNDAMQFAYMTYFLFLVLLPGILYFEKQFQSFWTVMTATAVTHYSVYVIAILFPIESPFFSLAYLHSAPLTGGPFTATIELVEHFGRVHGAAFPSAHVAGSMVAILAARRYKPWLYWICAPFFAAMCVATVYGRYHYVADVIAGIAVGAIGWAAAQKLMQMKSREA